MLKKQTKIEIIIFCVFSFILIVLFIQNNEVINKEAIDKYGVELADNNISIKEEVFVDNIDLKQKINNNFPNNYGKTIKFMFFGDLMLDRYVKTVIKNRGLDSFFEEIAGEENRFFSGIDIIGANLEGTVINDGKHYKPEKAYDFAFEPETVEKLKKYNFNYFTLANNHFADQGERGIIETRENLNSLGFYFSGERDTYVSEDFSKKIIEIKGKKVALIAFSMVGGLMDIQKAQKIVSESASSSDFVIINIHWGVEYEHEFNNLQKNTAHDLIDSGADVIIGHHPHVVQGMEIYEEKPIFYSLGNFIFDQSSGYFPEDNRQGLIIAITLKDNKVIYNLLPFEFENFQLALIIGEKKEKFIEYYLKWSELNENMRLEIRNWKFEINN